MSYTVLHGVVWHLDSDDGVEIREDRPHAAGFFHLTSIKEMAGMGWFPVFAPIGHHDGGVCSVFFFKTAQVPLVLEEAVNCGDTHIYALEPA